MAGLELCKLDELDCLIRGLLYVDSVGFNGLPECFYFQNPSDPDHSTKHSCSLDNPFPMLLVNIGNTPALLTLYYSLHY